MLEYHAGLGVVAGLDMGGRLREGDRALGTHEVPMCARVPIFTTSPGMNLASGMESNPNAFFIVVGAIAGQSCCLWGSCCSWGSLCGG